MSLNSQWHPSWIFDESLDMWVAPVPYPDDWRAYIWNEQNQTWILKDSENL